MVALCQIWFYWFYPSPKLQSTSGFIESMGSTLTSPYFGGSPVSDYSVDNPPSTKSSHGEGESAGLSTLVVPSVFSLDWTYLSADRPIYEQFVEPQETPFSDPVDDGDCVDDGIGDSVEDEVDSLAISPATQSSGEAVVRRRDRSLTINPVSILNFAFAYIPRHVYWLYLSTFATPEELERGMAPDDMQLELSWLTRRTSNSLRNPYTVAAFFVGLTSASPFLRNWPYLGTSLLSSAHLVVSYPFYHIDRPLLTSLSTLVLAPFRPAAHWGHRIVLTHFDRFPGWLLATPSRRG